MAATARLEKATASTTVLAPMTTSPEAKNPFHFGVVVLKGGGGHFGFAAAIDHGDLLGPFSQGRAGHVHGHVSGADDGHAFVQAIDIPLRKSSIMSRMGVETGHPVVQRVFLQTRH